MTCELNRLLVLVVYLSAVVCVRGQGQPVPRDIRSFTLPPGVYAMSDEVMDPPRDMDDVIRAADIIIDGTVITTFPSINLSPTEPGQVETDSLIGVRQVIRGQVPQSQIVLVESGGTQGQWRFVTRGNPLVKPSERYILFLYADRRKDVPNGVGILPDQTVAKRYVLSARFNGKAQVNEDGSVRFIPAAIAKLHEYDAPNVAEFLDRLNQRMAKLFPPAPPWTPPVGKFPPVLGAAPLPDK
jgi:hypothetical protein